VKTKDTLGIRTRAADRPWGRTIRGYARAA
jgi:hypothetical protein